MNVAKVVDIFVKITEQLSLHFYDFSTIFKRIYKFAVFQNKRKRNELCSWAPGMIWGLANMPLAGFEQGRWLGRPESGDSGHRRRGGSAGIARGRRALPLGGLGRGWDGREGARRRHNGGGGGGERRRRHSGGSGQRGSGREASPRREEARYGVYSGGKGLEVGSPR